MNCCCSSNLNDYLKGILDEIDKDKQKILDGVLGWFCCRVFFVLLIVMLTLWQMLVMMIEGGNELIVIAMMIMMMEYGDETR